MRRASERMRASSARGHLGTRGVGPVLRLEQALVVFARELRIDGQPQGPLVAPARQAQAPRSGDGRTAPSVPPARVSMPGTVPPPPDLLGLQHEAERGQWGAWLRPPAAAATLVHAGQDLPPAWRVLDVDPQGVWLQALSASAPPLRLVWSEPRWLQEMPHAHAP